MEGIAIFVYVLLTIMIGPPLILTIIGFAKRKTNPQTAKVYFILAAVYAIVGGGICARLLV